MWWCVGEGTGVAAKLRLEGRPGRGGAVVAATLCLRGRRVCRGAAVAGRRLSRGAGHRALGAVLGIADFCSLGSRCVVPGVAASRVAL